MTKYKFKCPYPECGNEFEREINSVGVGHKKVSNQVICKVCGNFLLNESGK